MKKTGISTMIGLGIGALCVISGIYESGKFESFYNLPSLLIIIGGTAGAVVTSFPPDKLKTLGPVIRKSFQKNQINFAKDIQTIIEIAEFIREKGALALESISEKYKDDSFLYKGIMLITDCCDKETLISELKPEIVFMKKRHMVGHVMMDMIADSVTSLGLLGTYVGLIPMLESLEDPASLGPLMAVELVSSFYGAFISYVIFGPLSNRLKIMSSDEVLRDTLLIEGFVWILDGKNPRVIQEHLLSSLTKKQAKRLSGREKRKKPLNFESKEAA